MEDEVQRGRAHQFGEDLEVPHDLQVGLKGQIVGLLFVPLMRDLLLEVDLDKSMRYLVYFGEIGQLHEEVLGVFMNGFVPPEDLALQFGVDVGIVVGGNDMQEDPETVAGL